MSAERLEVYNSFISLELIASGLSINAARILTYFIDCKKRQPEATFLKACQLMKIKKATGERAFRELTSELLIHYNNELKIYKPLPSKMPKLLKDALSQKEKYRQQIHPEHENLGLPIFSRQSLKDGLKFVFYQESQRENIAKNLELKEITQKEYVLFLAVYSYLQASKDGNKMLPDVPTLSKILGMHTNTIYNASAKVAEKIGFNFLKKSTYNPEDIELFKMLFDNDFKAPQPASEPPKTTSATTECFLKHFKRVFNYDFEIKAGDQYVLKKMLINHFKSNFADYDCFLWNFSQLEKSKQPHRWNIPFIYSDLQSGIMIAEIYAHNNPDIIAERKAKSEAERAANTKQSIFF